MNDDAWLIEHSYTGEANTRTPWAYIDGDVTAARCACTMLLVDMQTVDERSAVWLNGKKFSPSKQDLDDYHNAEVTRHEEAVAEAEPVKPELPKPQRKSKAKPAKEEILSEEDMSDLPPIISIRR
jgi:hypothetical protein